MMIAPRPRDFIGGGEKGGGGAPPTAVARVISTGLSPGAPSNPPPARRAGCVAREKSSASEWLPGTRKDVTHVSPFSARDPPHSEEARRDAIRRAISYGRS